MKTVKQISVGVGLFIVAGTPSYLIVDALELVEGNYDLLRYLCLSVFAIAVAGVTLRLVTAKGGAYVRMKPLWERLVALLALIFSLPLLLATMLLIKLDSRGPAIYRQGRIGRNRRRAPRRSGEETTASEERRNGDRRQRDLGGRPFTIYKLRSMVVDAEKETGAAWSTGDNDPRVTRVGHIIRKTHIDELPQLLNVVRGDMSLVGPRPERPDFIEELSRHVENYHDRLLVPGGITGFAQVRQKSDESLDDVKKKLQYDREYISKASFLLDLKVILETVALIFTLAREAFRGRPAEEAAPRTPETLLLDDSRANR